jgi:hypothetical protein
MSWEGGLGQHSRGRDRFLLSPEIHFLLGFDKGPAGCVEITGFSLSLFYQYIRRREKKVKLVRL